MPSSHSGRRGPRKQYSVPNKSFSLFTVTTGDSSGAVDSCPRNTSGQRVSTAGLGEGPLEGGPRDADGFLMKAEDDDLKIVIYQQMSMGEREFAIAFMAQDKPAPPGKPNACLSKYERAIIATYNDITTADFNDDTHWRELIERANAKGPAPQRLPKNPLVLPGVGTGKGKAEPAPQTASPVAFADLQRGAALDSGGGIGDLSTPDFEAPEVDLEGGPIMPSPHDVEPDPSVKHHRQKGARPPQDENGKVIEVRSTPEQDDAAVKLAMTVQIGDNEVAYTVADNGQVYVREGSNSRSVCVVGVGGFCLHTHPEEKNQTDQRHRWGFGEGNWQPVSKGLPVYLLNLRREVYVLEYLESSGYTPRFVDRAPYEGN